MKIRTKIKLEQIVRYRTAGIKDVRIAQLVGLSGPGLARILATPEYIEMQEAYLSGAVSKMDEAMSGRIDELNAQMRVGVPVAVRTLLEACTQRRDLKTAFNAAREILDRDPDKVFASKQAGDGVGQSNQLSPQDLSSTVGEADKVVDALASALTAQQKSGNA